MTVWSKYPKEQREEYIQFLQVYGGLSNLFMQKHGNTIPYLDSKFQETVFARVFRSQNADIGNTPHDIVSAFGDVRVGLGLKTWMNTKPSFQKVMQLKALKNDIEAVKGNPEELIHKISSIKNERLIQDYKRLGLKEDSNIYHYVTRDDGRFVIQESAYPLVELDKLKMNKIDGRSVNWTDGLKEYKYTFGDSQIWMKFSTDFPDTAVLEQFDVSIIDDPFDFLLTSFAQVSRKFPKANAEITEAYLPLYSYQSKEVEEKSGLNAWNAAPKNKGSNTLRPLGEIYIPVPIEFHRKNPNFFVEDIFRFIKEKQSIEFTIVLPNGNELPGRLTGDNLKNFQSGSKTLKKPDGKKYGQSDLGDWLLVDVLGLKDRQLVTREWLMKKGTDTVRIWHEDGNRSRIYIDFAQTDSFENYMNGAEVDYSE